MADVHNKETRSLNMSKIKGKDTGPELIVRKFLFAHGIRYRLYVKYLPGKPDIVIKKHKIIVDVRGCFWHGHKHCKFGDQISTESVHMAERVRSAIERDKVKVKKWRQLGWHVITIWDRCELESKKKNSERRAKILEKLLKQILKKSDPSN